MAASGCGYPPSGVSINKKVLSPVIVMRFGGLTYSLHHYESGFKQISNEYLMSLRLKEFSSLEKTRDIYSKG